MSVNIESNKVTGITTISSGTYAASKDYVDQRFTNSIELPEAADVFLTTDGSTSSFEEVGNYQEYTTPGSYTFNIPSTATELYVEATSGGGGGSPGVSSITSYSIGDVWRFHTSNNDNIRSGAMYYTASGEYVFMNTTFNPTVRYAASTDLIVWTLRTIAPGIKPTKFAYASGSSKPFAAIGLDETNYTYARLMFSTDGIVWTLDTLTGNSDMGWKSIDSIAWGNGRWVVGGSHYRAGPPGGGTRPYQRPIFQYYLDSGGAGVEWLAYGGVNSGDGLIPFKSWIYLPYILGSITSIQDAYQIPYDIKHIPSENLFLIVGSRGAIVTLDENFASYSGNYTWISRTSGIPGGGDDFESTSNPYTEVDIKGILHVPESPYPYLVYAESGMISSSTDLIVWTLRTCAFGHYSRNGYFNTYNTNTPDVAFVGYAHGLYVAGTDDPYSSQVSVSTDTIVWNLRSLPMPQANTYKQCGITSGPNSILYLSGRDFQESRVAPQGVSGSGGGGGATGLWKIPRNVISGSTLSLNVGSGGTSSNPGTATTISWTGPLGTHSITLSGGSPGSSNSRFPVGGEGGQVESTSICVYKNNGTPGADGTSMGTGLNIIPATNMYQTTGGASGGITFEYGASATGGNSSTGSIKYADSSFTDSSTSLNPSDATEVSGLAYGSGGNGGGSISSGAFAWTSTGSPFNAVKSITHDNTNIIASGGIPEETSHHLAVSTDTITWVIRTAPFNFSTQLYTLLYTPGVTEPYLGGGYYGFLMTSTDSISWRRRTSGFSSRNVYDAIYAPGPNLYLIGGDSGRLSVSTDAIRWKLRTSGFSTYDVNKIMYVSGATEPYIAAGEFGRLTTSTDTIVWTIRTTPGTNELFDMTYVPGSTEPYLLVGALRYYATSTDTIVWTRRTTGAIGNIDNIVNTPQTIAGISSYIATGQDGYILTSTDAISWKNIGLTLTNTYSTFLYENNNYYYASYTAGPLYKALPGPILYNGANGVKGGGGGGGSVDQGSNNVGLGGRGGDGYARITWI